MLKCLIFLIGLLILIVGCIEQFLVFSGFVFFSFIMSILNFGEI